ncbi:MAG: hypothetical protein LBD34_03345, partial [Puniceicoccales bacterium]|nr:hypothetical protein [Puniceicoccales bacterium]
MNELSLRKELTDKFSNMFLFDNIFNVYRFQAENDMFQFETGSSFRAKTAWESRSSITGSSR